MGWNNTLHTKVFDKNNNLISEYENKNLVVNQGKEILRDCLIKIVKQYNLPQFSSSNNGDYTVSVDGGTVDGDHYMWKALDWDDNTYAQCSWDGYWVLYNPNGITFSEIEFEVRKPTGGGTLIQVYANDNNTNTNEIYKGEVSSLETKVININISEITTNYIRINIFSEAIFCKFKINGGKHGLRNIKLSTNSTPPTLTDTSLGGTIYDTGLQTNETETNLESTMSFGTTTLEHDTLTIPFKYTNTTGNEITLYKAGLYDYNGGNNRLFSALLMNGSEGVTIPNQGYTLSYYKLIYTKGNITGGYLTDWGVKATIHALVYGNTDYNLDYVGLGSGAYTESNSINGLFATTQSTSILPSESNKILTSFDYTDVGGHQVEEVGVGHLVNITSECTTVGEVTTQSAWYDSDENTDGGFNGASGGKLSSSNNISKIRVLARGGSSGNLIVSVSYDTTDGTDGTWETILTKYHADTTKVWTEVVCDNAKSVKLLSSSMVIYEMEIYSLNLFSKFPHSKNMSDTENWVDTFQKTIG